MADNTDCGHSEWPLGTSTMPSCSMAKSVWESLFPSTLHAEVLTVHPLKYLCGFYPYGAWCSQEQRSSSPITSQMSSPAAHVPAESSGTSQMAVPASWDLWALPNEVRLTGKSKDCKHEPKQEETNMGWPKIQRPVLFYG